MDYEPEKRGTLVYVVGPYYHLDTPGRLHFYSRWVKNFFKRHQSLFYGTIYRSAITHMEDMCNEFEYWENISKKHCVAEIILSETELDLDLEQRVTQMILDGSLDVSEICEYARKFYEITFITAHQIPDERIDNLFTQLADQVIRYGDDYHDGYHDDYKLSNSASQSSIDSDSSESSNESGRY